MTIGKRMAKKGPRMRKLIIKRTQPPGFKRFLIPLRDWIRANFPTIAVAVNASFTLIFEFQKVVL